MAITTMLFAAFARVRCKWPMWRIALVAGVFMVVDLAFVAANAMKFADGVRFGRNKAVRYYLRRQNEVLPDETEPGASLSGRV